MAGEEAFGSLDQRPALTGSLHSENQSFRLSDQKREGGGRERGREAREREWGGGGGGGGRERERQRQRDKRERTNGLLN